MMAIKKYQYSIDVYKHGEAVLSLVAENHNILTQLIREIIKTDADQFRVYKMKLQTPTAYEWHNFITGHCYVDYIPKEGMSEKEGYCKYPLYK